MADLSIKNVKKIYSGGVEAVSNFNLEVKHGEFIVFVGPSGCGKSTMLRMIAGLESITEGDLVIDGKRVNDVAPADRNIAMVFQNYALFGTQTVYENIGFPLTIRHVNGDIVHEKVMEAAEIVEIEPELNRKPKALSGGQRQRVAIGRSLVRNPKVFLMDEPLSNLDAKLRTQTRKELAQLHKRLDGTFIYVTHDQVEAMTIADRIVVLNGGKIQQIGSPQEIYNNPANMFVGGFIGTPPMNFIEGRIENGRFVTLDMNIILPPKKKELLGAYEGKSVMMGVRPENIHFRGNPGESMLCHIDVVECLGSDYVIYFSCKGMTFNSKVSVSEVDFRVGDEVEVYLASDKNCFFDKETEERIV